MLKLLWTKNHLECENPILVSAEEMIIENCDRQSVVYLKTSSRPLTSNFCTSVKWPGDETCRHTHMYMPFPSCILFTKDVKWIWRIW
jgi:hypothetical protein